MPNNSTCYTLQIKRVNSSLLYDTTLCTDHPLWSIGHSLSRWQRAPYALLVVVGCSCSPAVWRCVPWPLGRRFDFYRFYRIVIELSFIVIVTEIPKKFRYGIIVSLLNDNTETFDTISNTN